MQVPPTLLHNLKLSQLHRLAVLLGTPCSGTKVLRIAGINDAICSPRGTSDHEDDVGATACLPPGHASVISIDMGIRNLAFAHFTTSLRPTKKDELRQYGPVTLRAWRKLDVVRSDVGSLQNINTRARNGSNQSYQKPTDDDLSVEEVSSSPKKVSKQSSDVDSYNPSIYADRAYNIIRSIVNQYKPTHILIERQRFRSGGSSAVLEWTLRVGVFEGMLYAVLKTLSETNAFEGQPAPLVEGLLPARVNRFWLERGEGAIDEEGKGIGQEIRVKGSKKGKEVKKAKIQIVGRLLESSQKHNRHPKGSSSLRLELGPEVQDLVAYFHSEIKRPVHSRRTKTTEALSDVKVSKLDDLADCLLQGLAWLNWRNHREKLKVVGVEGFELGAETAVKVSRSRKKRGDVVGS